MKVWALMGASAAVAMLSAAACTVEISDDDGGVGGAGGAADGGGGTTSQGGSGGTTSQGGAGGTGQGGSGGASCDTCNGFIEAGTGPVAGQFCGENMDLTCEPNTSCESFALLYNCVCEGSGQGGGGGAGGGGTCATECQATLCNIQPLDAACENCLIADLGGTCGGLYSACLAN